MNVEIRNLGLIDYAKAWQMQKELIEERRQEKIPDTLLVLEHPHVITLGKKSSNLDTLQIENQKDWQGVPVFIVERGGEATYHGPGQLVLYPIFKIPLTIGPKNFLRIIENIIITTLEQFDLQAHPIANATGVWVKDKQNKERKIASIGIALRHNISYHGLAINIFTDLHYFKKIKPCGFDGEIMINLSDLIKNISYEKVQEILIEKFKKCL